MNTTHNRIKVADLEKNERDKILTTNSSGELEFSNLDEIKIDSYNGLDYTQEGKSLDARQGKVLKDLVDNKIDKNFGPSQPNKLLGTDTNGNLKFYSVSTYPAPFLGEVLPSFSPNTTGNLTITGAYFTPSMTVSIAGQTVNYITFVNDNLIKVNITTGSIEGNFDITLNNGTSTTFTNALLVILGEVYEPIQSDWETLSGNLDLSEKGSVKLLIKDFIGSAKLISPEYLISNGLNFELRFCIKKSPLENDPNATYNNDIGFNLISDTGAKILGYEVWDYPRQDGRIQMIIRESNNIVSNFFVPYTSLTVFSIKRMFGIISFYSNGVLQYTSSINHTSNLGIKILSKELDFYNIKFIHLTS